jgi:hypothetical protein
MFADKAQQSTKVVGTCPYYTTIYPLMPSQWADLVQQLFPK